MAKTLGDLNTMLNDLSRVSQQVGLRMNMSKTKIMSNAHVPLHRVIIGSSALEIVDEYIYLGNTIQLGRSNFEKEVFAESNSDAQRSGNFETSFRPIYTVYIKTERILHRL
ncbi:jg13272 [Pararge aegeria aegeria]|uniref:Jg13272 protein n=1 Tax=Pararge aegeria aegeria TaxID=348720 RepID=A0A8S4REZ5_9NEOP|nr:jg13272 [Pararge aegeria aegeria]